MARLTWNFDSSKYEKTQYVLIPEGNHRAKIVNAEAAISSKDNKPMVKLTLEISGYSSKVWHYIKLDADKPEQTNKSLGDLFDSFGIANGDMETNHWIGKVGGVRIMHDTYNGEKNAKIKYLLYKEQQKDLPEWKGSSNQPTQAMPTTDLPWA